MHEHRPKDNANSRMNPLREDFIGCKIAMPRFLTIVLLRACLKNGPAMGLRARRVGWRGATREHIREKSVTGEQRRQSACPSPARAPARPPGIFFRDALTGQKQTGWTGKLNKKFMQTSFTLDLPALVYSPCPLVTCRPLSKQVLTSPNESNLFPKKKIVYFL